MNLYELSFTSFIYTHLTKFDDSLRITNSFELPDNKLLENG